MSYYSARPDFHRIAFYFDDEFYIPEIIIIICHIEFCTARTANARCFDANESARPN